MSDDFTAINNQYGQTDLGTKILNSLKSAGKDLDALTLDDLALFDQLHAGGRDATRALATMADLRPGMQVLDIGSGVGGPARTLAAEFGCQVIGLDLTEAFCEAAEILTDKVGLADRVAFKQGSALDLPFDAESFDVVWTQNTIMNIADKARVFKEAYRVLKPGGILPLEAIMMGSLPEILYPVFWANDASVSFLITPDEFRQLMADIGFDEIIWKDVTAQVVEGASRQQAGNSPSIGIQLVYDNVPEKGPNTLQCFKEGRIIDIQALFARSA